MKRFLRIILLVPCMIGNFLYNPRRARILMYHSFLHPRVFFNVAPEDFKKQIAYLIKRGFRIVSLPKLVHMIMIGDNIKNSLIITFDDGHQDFLSVAYPILKSHNIPATIFWPTGMKNDMLLASDGTPCRLMNAEEIKTLASDPLIDIGSHTVTHRELPGIPEAEQHTEINDPMNSLWSISGNKPTSFAYPRGKYDTFSRSEVEKVGYTAACTAYPPGVVSNNSDPYLLPRIFIGKSDDMISFKIKLSSLYIMYMNIYGKLYKNKKEMKE